MLSLNELGEIYDWIALVGVGFMCLLTLFRLFYWLNVRCIPRSDSTPVFLYCFLGNDAIAAPKLFQIFHTIHSEVTLLMMITSNPIINLTPLDSFWYPYWNYIYIFTEISMAVLCLPFVTRFFDNGKCLAILRNTGLFVIHVGTIVPLFWWVNVWTFRLSTVSTWPHYNGLVIQPIIKEIRARRKKESPKVSLNNQSVSTGANV